MSSVLVAVNAKGRRIGEDHQNAKYTNSEVELVLTLRDEGYTYDMIAITMQMPKSTVACFCRADRRAQTVARHKVVEIK